MNYKAEDIANFFKKHERNVTHVIVAHTKFRPCRYSQSTIDLMATQAKKDLRHALNCFSKQLYPKHTSLVQRKPHNYRPLTLVTIENIKETTDERQTIHFNISLGNLPKHICTTMIDINFRHAWHIKTKQQNDIYTEAIADYPSNPQKWFSYSVKDASTDSKLAWSTNGTWDVGNCWIPQAAINTD
jgi:hypothetical protein